MRAYIAAQKQQKERQMKNNLTFAQLAAASLERLPHFKNKDGNVYHKTDGSDWSVLEWGGAAAGEMGEALNIAKKLKRGDYTLDDVDPDPKAHGCTVRESLGKELADTTCYLEAIARVAGIDLGEAVRAKFNEISDRIGSPVKL
jgi:NTP pyrophosphatase (non-canonical NTP hydrolase)